MGSPSPNRVMATSLLPHVKDPQLAVWLLRQAEDLDTPVRIGAPLLAEHARPFLKAKVAYTVSAASACVDRDMLDVFSKDARVSVKRAVAAAPALHEETVDRLRQFALKNVDVEILGPLLDKIPVDWFVRELGASESDPSDARQAGRSPEDLASMLARVEHGQMAALFDRVVAEGSWDAFRLISGIGGGGSYRTAMLRRSAAERLGATVRGHAGLDVSDSEVPEVLGRGSLPVEGVLDEFTFWDEARARWAERLVTSPERSGFALNAPGSAAFRSYSAARCRRVDVDDTAADIIVSMWASGEGRTRTVDTARFVAARAMMHVASDPRQADRHFDALASSDDPAIVMNLIWTLSDAKRMTAARERKLQGPATELGLVTTAVGLPSGFGERLAADEQVSLLRAGSLVQTLGWLYGDRFERPTSDRIARLVADPGSAFDMPQTAARMNLIGTPDWELVQALPTPFIGRQDPAAGAADWVLSVFEMFAQEANFSDVVNARFDALRTTLTAETVVRVVDAAGASGVKAALNHPAWLHGRVAGLVGHDPQVWEGLLKLIPTWEQSLTELISIAALLVGIDISDVLDAERAAAEAGGVVGEESDPASPELLQLTLV